MRPVSLSSAVLHSSAVAIGSLPNVTVIVRSGATRAAQGHGRDALASGRGGSVQVGGRCKQCAADRAVQESGEAMNHLAEPEAGGGDGTGAADTAAADTAAADTAAAEAVADGTGAGGAAAEAEASAPARPETGEPRVDAALTLLDHLDEQPVTEHAAVFEQVHAELTAVLGQLDPESAGTDG
jgi:hypothetical protein